MQISRLLVSWIVIVALAGSTRALPIPALPVEGSAETTVPAGSAEERLADLAQRDGAKTWPLAINSVLLILDAVDLSQVDGGTFDEDEGGDAVVGALYSGLTVISLGENAWSVSGMLTGRPTTAQRAYASLPAGDPAGREAAARDALARQASRERGYRLATGLLELALGVHLLTDEPFSGKQRGLNAEGYTLALFGAIGLFQPTAAEKQWREFQRESPNNQ